jgi:hypothetical protein
MHPDGRKFSDIGTRFFQLPGVFNLRFGCFDQLIILQSSLDNLLSAHSLTKHGRGGNENDE